MQTITKLYALSKRNVILRYKNSIIGFFWGFIKPLLYLLIFIVVFSSQFSSTKNYVLYATSGLIGWFFFSNVTAQSIAAIVNSAGLIKSVKLPVILFPFSELVSELFNFLLTIFVFLIVMYWFGITYSIQLFALIPAALLFAAFSLGVILCLSALNVFFRDIGILWNTLLPALFYLTPIAYPEKLIPEKFKLVITINPIYQFIRCFRTILYESSLPAREIWVQCGVLSGASLIVGLLVFNRLKNQFISTI